MNLGKYLFALVILGIAIVQVNPIQGQEKTKYIKVNLDFGNQARDNSRHFNSFLLHNVVVDPVEKGLRLADSVLLTDEMGATDYHQSEPLSKDVYAKKIFVLDGTDMHAAELFFFGSAKEVTINGKELPAPIKLFSTGWSRVKIPTGLLHVGKNDIIFKGGGQLLVEPSKKPGHSFKSINGGKTWSREGLTRKANQEGEYLVRLRLGKYVSGGWAMSQVFDLWRTGSEQIATPGKLYVLEAVSKLPELQTKGIKRTALLRLGSTPSPDDKNWTDWFPMEKSRHLGEGKGLQFLDNQTASYRWGQLKFELASSKGLISPQFPQFISLPYTLGVESDQDTTAYQVTVKPDTHYLQSSTPFVYQKPSPRLKLLRERYKLDEVIAPGKTEMEQLTLLRHWVRHQWHTAWKGHPAEWMPPWDALVILANKDQPDCLTMCTHYAAVYTQCCLALGWNARHCILDHHCVAEVYVNELGKWVMMDAGNSAQRADVNLHFERKGVPMSARELHLAYHNGKTENIEVCFTPAKLAEKIAHLCRPAPPAKEKHPPRPDTIPLEDLKDYPVCQLNNYRRYAFPARNNFLDSLYPGELYQGWSPYYYDGYYWVGDSPDDPKVSPEYSLHLDPQRPHDIDWQLNWTQVYLSRTDKPGQLRVDLATVTPNFLHFERNVIGPDGKTLNTKTPDASFTWNVQPGTNTLTVWSVNQWERKGMPVEVTVQVK